MQSIITSRSPAGRILSRHKAYFWLASISTEMLMFL